MLKNVRFSIVVLLLVSNSTLFAQQNLMKLRWGSVVGKQPMEWYGTKEAIEIAENVLLYQRNVGGWPKNISMHHFLNQKEKGALQKLKKQGTGATIDNGSTYMELIYLSKVYSKNQIEKYKTAFLKGIDYLLEAQYDNGGWPQFYPLKPGYYTHITYNDNAMINVLSVLKEVADGGGKYIAIENDKTIEKAQKAYGKGIECILKTQYVQTGKLSVWCAQHDVNTLQPAKARAYELPSLSGSESAGIVLFLMDIENPSPEIIKSIESAVNWFEENKISGLRVERYVDVEGVREKRVIADKNAKPIWARFSELKDNRPFFCDRDGIKKYSLAEIGNERRNGYGWYGSSPQKVMDNYKDWQMKISD